MKLYLQAKSLRQKYARQPVNRFSRKFNCLYNSLELLASLAIIVASSKKLTIFQSLMHFVLLILKQLEFILTILFNPDITIVSSTIR